MNIYISVFRIIIKVFIACFIIILGTFHMNNPNRKSRIYAQNTDRLLMADEGSSQNKDRKIADEVMDRIDNIGTVENNDTSKNLIRAAREAYEGLTERQKEYVTNLEVLLDAEQSYNEFQDTLEENMKKILLTALISIVLFAMSGFAFLRIYLRKKK